ncbi:hypothetical protein N7922_10155 [Kosakonia sp. ML.JS2a]|nr:hypothetical protein [Kosakonia sp. ML.JS2a]UXY12839.1 hypothetical protein N7922_10155 [Kosakonia sp. ML.JS2a]
MHFRIEIATALRGGNGNVLFVDKEKAAWVFATSELTPLMKAMKHVNDRLGEEVSRFNPYVLLSASV